MLTRSVRRVVSLDLSEEHARELEAMTERLAELMPGEPVNPTAVCRTAMLLGLRQMRAELERSKRCPELQ